MTKDEAKLGLREQIYNVLADVAYDGHATIERGFEPALTAQTDKLLSLFHSQETRIREELLDTITSWICSPYVSEHYEAGVSPAMWMEKLRSFKTPDQKEE
jgi:hypothetical protein